MSEKEIEKVVRETIEKITDEKIREWKKQLATQRAEEIGMRLMYQLYSPVFDNLYSIMSEFSKQLRARMELISE